jgi:hypothetical protein
VEHQHGISCSGSSCGLLGPGFLASISIKLGLKNVGKTPFQSSIPWLINLSHHGPYEIAFFGVNPNHFRLATCGNHGHPWTPVLHKRLP